MKIPIVAELRCELGLVVVHQRVVDSNNKRDASLEHLQYSAGTFADERQTPAHIDRTCMADNESSRDNIAAERGLEVVDGERQARKSRAGGRVLPAPFLSSHHINATRGRV